jgi:hypothetical protein
VLYGRAWIVLRDHLHVADDQPRRLLEVNRPILRQLAVAASPKVETGADLGEQMRETITRLQETVLLLPGLAEELRNALHVELTAASAAEMGIAPDDEAESARTEARLRRYDAERLLADVDRPLTDEDYGQYELSASHDVISRTATRLNLYACEQLRAQIATATVDRRLLDRAIDVIEVTTTLFDRFVQESAGDDAHEQCDEDERASRGEAAS